MAYLDFQRKLPGELYGSRLAAILTGLLVALSVFLWQSPAQANNKYSGIVVDGKTGKVLYAHRANTKRYPASLTKMMTLYMMFEQFEQGKMRFSTKMRVSKRAAGQAPSKLYLKPGTTITAKNAMLALITKSANDVATVVAEHIGGTESGFARMMTKRARQLGMSKTTFKNASGLPNKHQVTTAKDMAVLGRAMKQHFPKYYPYFKTRAFKYGKGSYGNHNRLLADRGVDGIKTGYTRASGFNLVTNVEMNNRHIVAVVIGGKTGRSRDAHMRSLIKRYMRKASRSAKYKLIAKAGGTKAGKVYRVTIPPRPRPTLLASARPAKTDRTASVATAQLAYVRPKDQPMPVPVPAHKSESVSTHAGPTANPLREVQSVGGWHIQVAAVDTPRGAITLLGGIQQRFPGLLSNRRAYTEPVQSGSTSLYRARFIGFESKSDARNTCAALKKSGVNCLAIHKG